MSGGRSGRGLAQSDGPAERSAAACAVDVAANTVYLARRNLVFGLIFVRSRLWAALQETPKTRIVAVGANMAQAINAERERNY
jgi:hypothetical protein